MYGESFSAKYSVDFYTGCWNWIRAVSTNGYGAARYEGRNQLAHVISWKLHKGEIGNSKVLYKCDNKLCVNPDHLFLGTSQDNQVDCVRKGRHAQAILTVTDVEAIKSDHRKSASVAKDYGVCSSTIRKVRNGYNWKHV